MIENLVKNFFNDVFKPRIVHGKSEGRAILLITGNFVSDISEIVSKSQVEFYNKSLNFVSTSSTCSEVAIHSACNFIADLARYSNADAVAYIDESIQVKAEFAKQYYYDAMRGHAPPQDELPERLRENIAYFAIIKPNSASEIIHKECIVAHNNTTTTFKPIEEEKPVVYDDFLDALGITFTEDRYDSPFNTKVIAYDISVRIKYIERVLRENENAKRERKAIQIELLRRLGLLYTKF